MKNRIDARAGIKLCELKDRIYKTLGEYSANGIEIRDSEYEKSDLEKKILMCINTAVAKAVLHLPVYTLSKEIYFPEIKYICRKHNIELCENGEINIPVDAKYEKNAFVIKCSGNFSVIAGGNVVYESHSENRTEIIRHEFVIETENLGFVTLKAGSGGMYTDFLYVADGKCFDSIKDPEYFPDDGMTFAKTTDDIGKITYVANGGKSIPVYDYFYNGEYLYTDMKNSGKTVLHYTPKPHVFTDESAEDEVLLLPEITVCGVVYLAAAEMCDLSDSAAFNALSYKYRDISLNCYDREKTYKRNSFYDSSCEKIINKEESVWGM